MARLLAPDGVKGSPTLTPLEDVSVVEGSPAQFRTLVNGTPMPTVQWLREGQLIPPSPDFQVRRIHFLCFILSDLKKDLDSKVLCSY